MKSGLVGQRDKLKRVPSILVVDKDETMRSALVEDLASDGFRVISAIDRREALEVVEHEPFDLVFLDIDMPGTDGIETVERIKNRNSGTTIVMITGCGGVEAAVSAVKHGADDFLMKPFTVTNVRTVVDRVSALRRVTPGRAGEESGEERYRIVTRDPRMRRTLDLVDRIAPLPSTVLIEGESGTGKELVARRIHRHSPRSSRPFVAFNCAAMPEHLLESELFGYEKGAFTGADARKIGYFEAAKGGTLLIDEISEMSADLQAKLLRVLQERTVRRLGGLSEVPVDVRVVAATNRDLEEEVASGRFRRDLFYRINVVRVSIPPLRDRPQDITLLCEHFVRLYSLRLGRAVSGIEPAALERLAARRWEGNVRELQNAMESAVATARGSVIVVEDLPKGGDASPSAETLEQEVKPYQAAKSEFESRYLSRALESAHGNIALASRLTGISRQHFYDKLARHGLEQTVFRPSESGVA